jgi:hypothetical protein
MFAQARTGWCPDAALFADFGSAWPLRPYHITDYLRGHRARPNRTERR